MEASHRDLLSVLGHLYLSSGKPEKAKTVYEALHAEHPDDESVALALAYARLRCEEFSAAIDLVDGILRSQGKTKAGKTGKGAREAKGSQPAGGEFARLIRAKALWKRGDKDEARREMRRFLESAPLREVSLAARPSTAAGRPAATIPTPTRA